MEGIMASEVSIIPKDLIGQSRWAHHSVRSCYRFAVQEEIIIPKAATATCEFYPIAAAAGGHGGASSASF